MKGPISFVFTILWIGIGLATFGTLKDCTGTMIGLAADSSQKQMALGSWNRRLVDEEKSSK